MVMIRCSFFPETTSSERRLVRSACSDAVPRKIGMCNSVCFGALDQVDCILEYAYLCGPFLASGASRHARGGKAPVRAGTDTSLEPEKPSASGAPEHIPLRSAARKTAARLRTARRVRLPPAVCRPRRRFPVLETGWSKPRTRGWVIGSGGWARVAGRSVPAGTLDFARDQLRGARTPLTEAQSLRAGAEGMYAPPSPATLTKRSPFTGTLPYALLARRHAPLGALRHPAHTPVAASNVFASSTCCALPVARFRDVGERRVACGGRRLERTRRRSRLLTLSSVGVRVNLCIYGRDTALASALVAAVHDAALGPAGLRSLARLCSPAIVPRLILSPPL
eukprot:354629-Chlamydomonas_euryale.AAC.1